MFECLSLQEAPKMLPMLKKRAMGASEHFLNT